MSQPQGRPALAPSPAPASPLQITVIRYDEGRFERKALASADECAAYRQRPMLTWINLDGVMDARAVQTVASQFALHPLTVEDIVNTRQRPRMETFDDYVYVVARMLTYDPAAERIASEQVSIIVADKLVITFQESPGDVFDSLRAELGSGKSRARRMGPDYLLYSLLDAIVDNYFVICEKVGGKIEPLQEELIVSPSPKALRKIQRIKREVIFLRKCVWPLREVVSGLERAELPFFTASTPLYLRDLYGHTIQVMDNVETYRDMLASTVDIYMSSISNRLNEVMKVLTIIATIFIPLTFIASIYGMNFRHMPEIPWRYGYPAVLLAMAVVAGIMLLYFRRKRWM